MLNTGPSRVPNVLTGLLSLTTDFGLVDRMRYAHGHARRDP